VKKYFSEVSLITRQWLNLTLPLIQDKVRAVDSRCRKKKIFIAASKRRTAGRRLEMGSDRDSGTRAEKGTGPATETKDDTDDEEMLHGKRHDERRSRYFSGRSASVM